MSGLAPGTPLPWIAEGDDSRQNCPFIPVEGDTGIICEIYGTGDDLEIVAEDRANAAYIVHAANCFPELVETLQNIDEACQAGLNSADPAHWEATLQDIMEAVRAALAKASSA